MRSVRLHASLQYPLDRRVATFALTALLVMCADLARALAPGQVLSHQKISDTVGGFAGTLANVALFGTSVASLGDLDGDGIVDVAVGAQTSQVSTIYPGAVWILFLNANGTVKSEQWIANGQGGFTGTVDDNEWFGSSVAAVTDLDGDTINDLAVGAAQDNDGGSARGAVWVLFLNSNGTVKSHQKVSDTAGNFTGVLDNVDYFGRSVASLGDLDNDGIGDIAVGAHLDDDGGTDRGAVWILFLNSNGTVKSHQKISSTQGGFTGILDNRDWFGYSVAGMGDFDGDGVTDLAVGASLDDDGAGDVGAVWLLFLNSNGTVKSHQKISRTAGGFTGTPGGSNQFGSSVALLGDVDCDGARDLAVGNMYDTDGGSSRGAVWVLLLNGDGTVKSHQKISDTQGNFTGVLDNSDLFGKAVAGLGDLDGDGLLDLAVGAWQDDDGGVNLDSNRGAVWVLFLDGMECTIPVAVQRFRSYWTGFHAEVAWVLRDIGGRVTFDILRREGAGDYLRIEAPHIVRRGEEYVFEDHAARPGSSYDYHVLILEDGEPVTSFETSIRVPAAMLALDQNRPNPFNLSTRFTFSVGREERVILAMYDVSGRLVRVLIDRPMAPGVYSQEWDGRDQRGRALTSGIYFCRLNAGNRTLTQKIVLVK